MKSANIDLKQVVKKICHDEEKQVNKMLSYRRETALQGAL